MDLNSHPHHSDRQRRPALARRSPRLAGLLAALVLTTVSPGSAAAQDLESQLQQAEAELMKQLQEAEQAETAQNEAEERARREQQQAEEKARRAEQEASAKQERAEARRVQGMLERESGLQSELMRRSDRNERAAKREELGAHSEGLEDVDGWVLGARATPAAPADRDLPRAIFDDKKVTIPARTWGNPGKLKLTELILDADRDGKPEVKRYVERKTGEPVHQEEDRDYDGRIDAWKDYESGSLVRRKLDSNGDGKPDVWEFYAQGRLTESKADRDGDSIVDAIYRYGDRFLNEEAHDANADGEIDLVIHYQAGNRVRAEEDQDRDGRYDTWTVYRLDGELEMVARIERDKRGRGYADTFESFEPLEGRSVLSRREEDVNGDGKVDMVSIYRAGKLVRREIFNPEVVKL